MSQDIFENVTCKICDQGIKNRRSLGNHLNRSHGIDIKQYYLKYYLNDCIPLCQCGCGKEVNWHKTLYKFNDYITGHNESGFKTGNYIETNETKEKRINSIKSIYSERKEEIVNKISNSLKQTFSDPEQKERMSRIQKERWGSEEFKERLSKSQKKAWEDNYQERYEKVFTEEFRKKISLSNMERNTKRKSELESVVFEQIKKIYPDVVEDYWINDEIYNAKCYDMYVPSLNLLIELDGVYWHGLDREKNFTKDQIHNMTNDIYKNRIARLHLKNLSRIILDNDVNIQSIDDLEKIIYYKQVDGKIIYNNSFKFEKNDKVMLDRDYVIGLNLKSKEYVEKELLPVLVKYFYEYVKEYGWFFENNHEDIIEVINKIKNIEIDYDSKDIKNGSILGNSFLKDFFKSYWNVEDGPVKNWNNINSLTNVIKYRLGINNSKDYVYKLKDGTNITCQETFDISPKNIIRGFIVQKMAVSWFKPVNAYEIYKRLLKDNPFPIVWDPSMGFGARLLGFISAYNQGVYFGTDPAIETFRDLQNLKYLIEEKDLKHEIYIENTGSEKVELPSDIGDLVFTSPPYFNTEKYFNESGQCWLDYPDLLLWKEKYLSVTFNNAFKFLKDDGKLAINISEKYKNDIIDIATQQNFKLVDQYSLILNKDHFSKKRGNTEIKKEPILIFEKNL